MRSAVSRCKPQLGWRSGSPRGRGPPSPAPEKAAEGARAPNRSAAIPLFCSCRVSGPGRKFVRDSTTVATHLAATTRPAKHDDQSRNAPAKTKIPVKKIIILLALVFGSHAFAQDAVGTFRAGLQAFEANGPDALFRAWYSADEDTRIAELRTRLAAFSARLGPVLETEIFAPKTIGKRLTRVYGVIYFTKRPLWIRADYYRGAGTGGFIALEFSLRPDEIFPMETGVYSR